MPANVCNPLFRPGQTITAQATATITGKRFVDISATRGVTDGLVRVAPPAAGAAAFGVAAHDAANGGLVAILRAGVVPVTAGANIAAGARVEVDNQGRVITLDTGISVGKAIETASSGSDVMIAIGD